MANLNGSGALLVSWLILASLESHLVVARKVRVAHVLLLLVLLLLLLLHLVHHMLVHFHEVLRRGWRRRPVSHRTHMRWRRRRHLTVHLAIHLAEGTTTKRHHLLLLALEGVHRLLHGSIGATACWIE